jgi:hypothetical protein
LLERAWGTRVVVLADGEAVPTAYCSVRARNGRQFAWMGASPGGAGVPSASRSISATASGRDIS